MPELRKLVPAYDLSHREPMAGITAERDEYAGRALFEIHLLFQHVPFHEWPFDINMKRRE